MTDSITTVSTAVASLVVAGLGVYAYTQLTAVNEDTPGHDTQTHAQRKDTSANKEEGVRRIRRKRRGKAVEPVGGEDKGKARAPTDDVGLPGGFEPTTDAPVSESISGSAKLQKKKKKKKVGKTQSEVTQPDVRPSEAQPERTAPKKKKKKKVVKESAENRETVGRVAEDSTDADASVSLSPSASRLARAPPQREILRSLSLDTDSSWTHVDRGRLHKTAQVEASSDLTSIESSSPIAERVVSDIRGTRGVEKRTLAEKLVPRPEQTSVDDMLEQPSIPTLARVMRVQPPTDESPVPGFSWEDYGDVVEESTLVHDADQEDEGEWGIVKSRNRTRPAQTPAIAVAPLAAQETLTKKQRQNARKKELAKAVKAETEAARLEGLAKHKRELERLRIIEQSRQGGGKQTSGGMHATVDDRGRLVWE